MARSRLISKARGSSPKLTESHQMSFSEEASRTIRLSLGERPVLLPL